VTTRLSVALGIYPVTRALHEGAVRSDLLDLHFARIAPISRAFAPMVRTLQFDVCEMAIATVLQALAAGKRIVPLPVVVAGRFQEQALLCRAGSDIAGPADLAGRRIGVRSYSQTTGLWLRGRLREAYGIAPDRMRWVTFEDAHVAEYRDPAWVERAPPGADLLEMLKAGDIDAVIVGNDRPQGADLRTVFPDPAASGEAFWQHHRFVPVNHMVTVRRALLEQRPDLIVELVRLFRAAHAGAGTAPPAGRDPCPIGRTAIEPAIRLAARYAFQQGLVAEPLDTAAFWRGLPEAVL
jgi:4,5-dihydroxyphthalate decarboxylase